mmetsp:Transcript_7021/g.11794  ORF Transcript_7021/g.11794 Transcript_7021/m.11794 type:complete len:115 (-) Transcript_7021:286-630(-)
MQKSLSCQDKDSQNANFQPHVTEQTVRTKGYFKKTRSSEQSEKEEQFDISFFLRSGQEEPFFSKRQCTTLDMGEESKLPSQKGLQIKTANLVVRKDSSCLSPIQPLFFAKEESE